MDKIIELLNSNTILVTALTLLITAFAKTIVKIFNMGVMFKSNLATKKDQKDFESEMKSDMRAYANQIQQITLQSCMKVIEKQFKDYSDIKTIASDMKALKAQMDAESKITLEKYSEVRNMGETVRTLSNKVQRLEYQDQSSTMERRKVE